MRQHSCVIEVQPGLLQHTHTHLLERELLILSEEIILASSPSLSHCHILRGDLLSRPKFVEHEFSYMTSLLNLYNLLNTINPK